MSDYGAAPVDPALIPLWDRYCTELHRRLGDDPVRTWFQTLSPIRLDEEREQFVVGVPGAFHLEWLVTNYGEVVRESTGKVFGNGFETVFEVVDHLPPLGWTPAKSRFSTNQTGITAPTLSLRIKPELCFETFIAGEGSRFARSIAENVAAAPGSGKFNPVLIHGGVGLGKTHLLHAIANFAMVNRTARNPILTTSEQFTSDYIQAIQDDKKRDFTTQYADSDLLLVDDVQFFMGREQTQRHFFHIFDLLINAGKQIVITSDRPPSELNHLDERLRSRFQQGVTVEVAVPEFEARVAILRVWAARDGIPLPAPVEEFLATHITSNVRNLRGAVVHLVALATLEKTELTVEIARRTLRDLLSRPRELVTIERIAEIVAQNYHIDPSLFSEKTRKQPIAEARMIVMALACELTGLPLASIGLRLGKRDHTTVMHARDTIRERCEHDPDFRRRLEEFKRTAEHGITL